MSNFLRIFFILFLFVCGCSNGDMMMSSSSKPVRSKKVDIGKPEGSVNNSNVSGSHDEPIDPSQTASGESPILESKPDLIELRSEVKIFINQESKPSFQLPLGQKIIVSVKTDQVFDCKLFYGSNELKVLAEQEIIVSESADLSLKCKDSTNQLLEDTVAIESQAPILMVKINGSVSPYQTPYGSDVTIEVVRQNLDNCQMLRDSKPIEFVSSQTIKADQDTIFSVKCKNNLGEEVEAINNLLVTLHKHKENVKIGFGEPIVDYLFVIDNSVSMKTIINKVNDGFNSLAANPAAFPANSRIGVMTTLIGQLPSEGGNLAIVSSLIKAYTHIEKEPGFLSLVDSEAIKSFLAIETLSDNVKSKFPFKGCSKWFLPNQVNEDSISCFNASTQVSLAGVNAEAGIKAFEQLLIKHANLPLFRDNVNLSVVFVSDTHDPGRSIPSDVVYETLNYEQFVALAKSLGYSLQSLKFHAIAPLVDKCADKGEGIYNKAYLTLADESGGRSADSCTSTDYTGVISGIVDSSKIVNHLMPLTKKAKQILKVMLNGSETNNYTFLPESNEIMLNGIDMYKNWDVQIEYEYVE